MVLPPLAQDSCTLAQESSTGLLLGCMRALAHYTHQHRGSSQAPRHQGFALESVEPTEPQDSLRRAGRSPHVTAERSVPGSVSCGSCGQFAVQELNSFTSKVRRAAGLLTCNMRPTACLGTEEKHELSNVGSKLKCEMPQENHNRLFLLFLYLLSSI